MSNVALSWALSCRCGSSSAKAVLLVMANAANDKPRKSHTGQVWPPLHAWLSQASLADLTELDRKTIGPALARLESRLGLIVRAGSEGNTRQIPVYKLLVKDTENGLLPDDQNEPETGGVSSAVDADQSTPFFPAKDPVFPGEGSRFSPESTPKTGHGTQGNPSGTQEEPKKKARRRASGFDASAMALPEWLDRDLWASWVADRVDRGMPITKRAAAMQIAKLDEFRQGGHAPASVIGASIEAGWTGLYPPKSAGTKPFGAPRGAPPEPTWRAEQRDRVQQFAGPAAARPFVPGTIDMVFEGAPVKRGESVLLPLDFDGSTPDPEGFA